MLKRDAILFFVVAQVAPDKPHEGAGYSPVCRMSFPDVPCRFVQFSDRYGDVFCDGITVSEVLSGVT